MYKFFYTVFYHTCTAFLNEEDAKHTAKLCCVILPLLVFIAGMFFMLNGIIRRKYYGMGF